MATKKKKNESGLIGTKLVLGVRVVILLLPFRRPIPALSLYLGVRLPALLWKSSRPFGRGPRLPCTCSAFHGRVFPCFDRY